MSKLTTLVFFAVAACGSNTGPGGGVDAPVVAKTITVSGTASEIGISGATPVAGVLVEAFANSADTTVVAMATTDASGNYTLTITTNGQALDGFVKGSKATYIDTYLYAPAPLTADFTGAPLNMLTPTTFDLLANTLCRGAQDAAKGTIAVIVHDAAAAAVAGATVASTPAATKYCYNGANGLPSSTATATAADGTGYMFNVTGSASVTATKSGSTFAAHSVTARAGALTTTLIQP